MKNLTSDPLILIPEMRKTCFPIFANYPSETD